VTEIKSLAPARCWDLMEALDVVIGHLQLGQRTDLTDRLRDVIAD
jgi:hypothetical protein